MSADQIDQANDISEAYLASAINKARNPAAALRLKPRGTCYNCMESLSIDRQIFCDSDCAEDYEYVEARKNANRRTV